MDANSELRLELVNPKLAALIRKMAAQLESEGIAIRVTQGLRSWTEQLGLWQKGRDGFGNIVNPALVVTKAPPGHSYHNFGLAVDVAPFAGNIPDWNVNHPAWKRMVEVGESLGLTSGATFRSFPDYPHFQLTGTYPASPTDEVRQAFKDHGTVALWEQAGLGGNTNA